MLDNELLLRFMHSFYGYGNPAGPLWFVGMEEGGGQTMAEVQNRLDAWNARGQRPIEDCAAFHHAIGLGHFFSQGAPLQRTWRQLIRTVLTARGSPTDTEQLKSFQTTSFARNDGCLAILELLPLPSPKTSAWHYGPGEGNPSDPWTNIDYLQTRRDYRRQLLPGRIAGLKDLIRKHTPRAVLFYGESYRREWQLVSGISFPKGQYSLQPNGTTQYMLLPHPTPQFGPPPDSRFAAAGALLRDSGIA
jgi:hypothetical protein